MARFLRYTSFQPGELEAQLRELTPPGQSVPTLSMVKGGKALLKTHSCKVQYPDGHSGECRYERMAPKWHLFHYVYEELPIGHQAYTYAMENSVASIEAKAQELTAAAYRAAIDYERRNYFQRASEPKDGSRKRQPHLYRMKAAQAKELAGRYALCRRSGTMLFVFGKAYESLNEANAAWREMGDTKIVVGCCNRLDRCWQLPRFNTLYAEFDPRVEPTLDSENTSSEEGTKTMSRCIGSDPETGAQCTMDALSGSDHCAACAGRISEECRTFQSWMKEVAIALDGLCGMSPDDISDCPYADWHGAGLEPDEAAAQALEWAS